MRDIRGIRHDSGNLHPAFLSGKLMRPDPVVFYGSLVTENLNREGVGMMQS